MLHKSDGSPHQGALPECGAGCPDIVLAVVEDDVRCRAALVHAIRGAPDMVLAWESATCQHALEQLADQPLAVLVVDLGLPDGSGLNVIAAARHLQPGCAIMVNTMFGDEAHILPAIEAGAMGYMLKDTSPIDMLHELRSLHAGGSPIHPMVARKLLQRLRPPTVPAAPTVATPAFVGSVRPIQVNPDALDSSSQLSEREQAVLRLVSLGYSELEVGESLGITRHTVRTYVQRVYVKLQVDKRAEAIRVATERGLLMHN